MRWYVTQDLPGIGGTIKEHARDFRVEEVELQRPAGKGEHLYLRIEKESLTTHEAVARLARALRLSEREVGFAGIKDARAITTQWVSVPARCQTRLEDIHLGGITILEADRHTHRLKSGQLAGNRFQIRIRNVGPQARARAHRILDVLGRTGVPNFFGPQRFGTKGDSDLIGKAVYLQDYEEALRLYLGAPSPRERDLRIRTAREIYESGRLDEYAEALPRFLRNEHRVLEALQRHGDPQRALARIPKSLRLLFLSAYQARLFNHCLLERLDHLSQLQPGDAIIEHASGAAAVVHDVEVDQPRADRFEISPAGPLFGSGLLSAAGDVARREAEFFAAEGIDPRARSSPFRDVHLRGERRSYRFAVEDIEVEEDAEGLLARFALPRGAYATTVLAEIMKPADPYAESERG